MAKQMIVLAGARRAAQLTGAKWMMRSLTGSLALGAFLGALVALAPDHLGTIMTLSVASDSFGAFRVGATWALGHAAGMGTILLLLFFTESAVGFSTKRWERASEYVIGVSMILCALYFIAQESHYIRESADGTQTVLSCECCTPGPPHSSVKKQSAHRKKGFAKFCDSFGRRDGGHESDFSNIDPGASSTAEGRRLLAWSGRDINGAVMGIVQGFCCPMSIVGTTFTSAVSTPLGRAAFVTAFVAVSTVGTGMLAMGWSHITRSSGSWLPPRVVYRATCVFTMLFGFLWIVATAAGKTDFLEWTERLMDQEGAEQRAGS